MLKSRPVLANCLVCGTLFGCGDLIASSINPKPDVAKSAAKAALYGSMVYGVVASTVTYPILNHLAPNLRAFPRLIARLVIDQGLFAPFIYTPMYFGTMSLMDMQSPAQAIMHIQHNWWPTVEAGWSIWIPVQILNFSIIPQQFRIATVAIAGLVWNTILGLKNAASNSALSR